MTIVLSVLVGYTAAYYLGRYVGYLTAMDEKPETLPVGKLIK